MLAVLEAQNMINSANIAGIDNVYTFNIPAEMVENVDKTIVLITDANTNPAVYGNNDFNALSRTIEIQVFYKKDLDVDPEQVEVQLYKVFTNDYWNVGENRGHTIDPDTQQITTTFYVNNLKLLNN